jgi:predicted Fe-Mo cluster-binding NifX family protein
MKIAVSATADNIDAMIDPRFGRCTYFMIVETDGTGKNAKIKGSEAFQNTATQAMRGAGVTAAQTVVNKGANVVLTGNVGPNAFGALSQAGVKIITGVGGMTVKDAVQKYLNGELKETAQPTNLGFGPRMGSGTGRGVDSERGRGIGGRRFSQKLP